MTHRFYWTVFLFVVATASYGDIVYDFEASKQYCAATTVGLHYGSGSQWVGFAQRTTEMGEVSYELFSDFSFLTGITHLTSSLYLVVGHHNKKNHVAIVRDRKLDWAVPIPDELVTYDVKAVTKQIGVVAQWEEGSAYLQIVKLNDKLRNTVNFSIPGAWINNLSIIPKDSSSFLFLHNQYYHSNERFGMLYNVSLDGKVTLLKKLKLKGYSTDVVHGGRNSQGQIVVSGYAKKGETQKRFFMVLNESGELVHSKVFSYLRSIRGMALLKDGIVLGGDSEFIKFSWEGKELWRKKLEKVNRVMRLGESCTGDVLFFNLYPRAMGKLSGENGEILWLSEIKKK